MSKRVQLRDVDTKQYFGRSAPGNALQKVPMFKGFFTSGVFTQSKHAGGPPRETRCKKCLCLKGSLPLGYSHKVNMREVRPGKRVAKSAYV